MPCRECCRFELDRRKDNSHTANMLTTHAATDRFVNDYRTGDVIRPATHADTDRAEPDGDPHTGAHLDDDGRTIFVDE